MLKKRAFQVVFWISTMYLFLAGLLWFYRWWGGTGVIIGLFTFIPLAFFPIAYLLLQGIDGNLVFYSFLWIVALASGSVMRTLEEKEVSKSQEIPNKGPDDSAAGRYQRREKEAEIEREVARLRMRTATLKRNDAQEDGQDNEIMLISEDLPEEPEDLYPPDDDAIVCPHCNKENPADALYCNNCGTYLANYEELPDPGLG